MTERERELAYIAKWRPAASKDDSMAMSNVAAAYRIMGNLRLSFRWFKRAADFGDGDAMVESGYCYQHGAGVRRNTGLAEAAYHAAIRSKYITPFAREEAMYHLATLLIQCHPKTWHRTVRSLLRRANADNDYPQASALLCSLTNGQATKVCVCRRGLMRRLAILKCPIHRKPAG